VSRTQSAPFRGSHFDDVIIILCVRWYLRYSLSYRDLKEMMAERGVAVDHVTIWRLVPHYAPLLISGFAANSASQCFPAGG
jgi:transposase-like protein